jgi:hypothetical protein
LLLSSTPSSATNAATARSSSSAIFFLMSLHPPEPTADQNSRFVLDHSLFAVRIHFRFRFRKRTRRCELGASGHDIISVFRTLLSRTGAISIASRARHDTDGEVPGGVSSRVFADVLTCPAARSLSAHPDCPDPLSSVSSLPSLESTGRRRIGRGASSQRAGRRGPSVHRLPAGCEC